MTKEELLKKIDFEKNWLYECGIFGSDVDIAFHAIKKSVIEALDQEPKIGHWIAQDNYHTVFNCSECGDIHSFMHDYNYCPNCGAKMVEPQERSDKE